MSIESNDDYGVCRYGVADCRRAIISYSLGGVVVCVMCATDDYGNPWSIQDAPPLRWVI